MRLLVILLLLVSLSRAQTLLVAVAAGLRPPAEEIADLFQRRTGVRIKLSFASSGALYRQILGGAPYDVFLSADPYYAQELIRRGRAVEGSLTVFAYGKLVLFCLRLDTSRGLDTLRLARRVAIANPRYAPYGRAAVEVLKRSGLYGKIRDRIVTGSNVEQAFQFVAAGGADCGLVSLSLARSFGEGSYWVVPGELYEPVVHAAVALRGVEPVFEFLRFLKGKEAKEILRKYGFEVR